jgi:hypothetical protein
MDEDLAGMTRIVGRNTYAVCAACGAPFSRRRPAAARGPGNREPRDLCPTCYRELMRGERATGHGEEE